MANPQKENGDIMWCKKYEKDVKVKDCEECLSMRICDPICLKRHFIWGLLNNKEPIWVKSYNEGKNSDEDISMYFDENWEGNTHLLRNKIEKIAKQYQKTPIPNDIRWEVWKRDNFTCQHCGKRKYLTIDHIYPESKGGKTELSNLQTLCKSCNSKKGTKIVK